MSIRNLRLEDLAPDEAARIHYEDLVVMRRALFARCIAEVGDGPAVSVDDAPPQSCGAHVRDWAARMTVKHAGVTGCKVHRNPFLPWLEALMVVVWGEAPFVPKDGQWEWQWPREWTPELVARALAWEDGSNIPGAVNGRAIIGVAGRRIVRADLTSAPER